MVRFENQTFGNFEDHNTGNEFADIEFIKCTFVGGGFSSISLLDFKNEFLKLRSVARRVKFINCSVKSVGFVGPGIVEDSLLDGLKVSNHVQTRGTVFKHVVVRGAVDKFMITPYIDFTGGTFANVQKAYDEANRKYYETVDWALDIREALFKDCDIRAIPAHLIRRDPETQVVLTREKAMEGRWREIDMSGTHWPTAIQFFLDDGYQDCVLVASKKARKFKALLEGLNRLRHAGIVEPD